jgi:hypothetical protein
MWEAARVALARATQPEADRPASVAERFGCEDTVHMYRLRYGGMASRAVRAGIGRSKDVAALQEIADRLDRRCELWHEAARAADQSVPIAIEALVGVQYGAIMAAASYLAGRLAP